MKTVWIVYVDTWTQGWGSTIYLLGIFDDEVKAIEAKEIAEKEYKSVSVEKVDVNKIYQLTNPFEYSEDDYDDDESKPAVADSIYLGGYIE